MIVKLLKLPLKFFALAAALCLFLIHAACGILLGLSSIVTRLLASVFLLGAAAEWIAGAPDVMAYQCLGIGNRAADRTYGMRLGDWESGRSAVCCT